MDVLEQVYEAFSDANQMEGPLAKRLEIYQERLVGIVPPIDPAYEGLVKRYMAAVDSNDIPNVGDSMPDFLLPNDEGGLTGLEDILELGGPTIISFNRGHWCFHCMLELSAWAAVHNDAAALGGRIISIVPERVAHLKTIGLTCHLPFPLLSDLNHGLSTAMGLVVSARNELHELFTAAGLDIGIFQGNDSWMLPIPSVFIVDDKGIIKARFLDPDFRKRSDPVEIISNLRALASAN